MGDGRRRRRKKAQIKSATEDIPDELLCLVFMRLTSPVYLVRAASACRRWRRVIAADVLGGSQAQQHRVIGHYHVDEPLAVAATRPPGRHPVFLPGAGTKDVVVVVAAAAALDLDFLPRTEFGELNWELADVRGGLLLLACFSHAQDLLGLVACDPLARRYKTIPFSAWFHGQRCFLGAFLRPEDDDAAGISLSDFGVTCVLYRGGIAKAYAFSSSAAGGGRWTSGAARGRGGAVNCRDGYQPVSFAGSTAGSAYWTLGVGVRVVVALDKETGELSSASVLPDALRSSLDYAYELPWPTDALRPSLDYAYELPWPPTIRACLS